MQTCLWHAATPALACTSCRLPLHSMQLGCSARHMTSVLPCGVASLSLFQITALPRCRGARLAAQIAAAHALALTLPCPALYCLSRAGLAAELAGGGCLRSHRRRPGIAHPPVVRRPGAALRLLRAAGRRCGEIRRQLAKCVQHHGGSTTQAAGRCCRRPLLKFLSTHIAGVCCSLVRCIPLCEHMHAATHRPHLCPALLTPAEPLQAPWCAAPCAKSACMLQCPSA